MSSSRDLARGLQSMSITHPPPEDISGNLRILRQLHSHFKTLRCRGQTCRTPLPLPAIKGCIKTWLAGAKGPQPAQASDIYCRKCKKWTCIGCRGKPALGRANVPTPIATINNCCNQGRLFGIWLLLCRFDEVEMQLQKRAEENARKNMFREWKDDGRGIMMIRRMGSGGRSSEAVEYRQQDDLTHDLMGKLLQLLTAFLPRADSSSSFDKHPPLQLFTILRLSLLLESVTALIGNDSIADMSKRSELHKALLAFVTAAAKYPELVKILTEKRPEKKMSPGLQALDEESTPSAFVFDTSRSGMSASLAACSGSTFKQAKAFASLASKPAMASELLGNRTSISICKRILEFREVLKRTAPDAIRSLFANSANAWTVYTEANKVTFTDDVLKDHKFTKDFNSIRQNPPGRMAHLWKEIANLSTSLPEGIFLKVAERRPDVMKVLIVGAKGSPYAWGVVHIRHVLFPKTGPKFPQFSTLT